MIDFDNKLLIIILCVSFILPFLFTVGDTTSYLFAHPEMSLVHVFSRLLFQYLLRVLILGIFSLVVSLQVKEIITALREKPQ